MVSDLSSNDDFLLENYNFTLPQELIAQRPMVPRRESRLMVYNKKENQVTLTHFSKLADFLPKDSHLIFNQTKVYPARLLAQKSTGGRAEIFVLSLEKQKGAYPCLLGFSGKKHVGQEFLLSDGSKALVEEVLEGGLFALSFNQELPSILAKVGQVPIPPYIRDGLSDKQDLEDYQTIYAKHLGSVAAPTAGLHFDQELLSQLQTKKVAMNKVCLHVGMGTFAPVKTSNIFDHQMHSEEFFVEAQEWQAIKEAKNRLAVGTTSLRALESIFKIYNGEIIPEKRYQTNIFLHPGKEITSVQGLITNFHLPKSSLLMLVSALIGREKLLELYDLAIKEKFRFYSYGDAMCVLL